MKFLLKEEKMTSTCNLIQIRISKALSSCKISFILILTLVCMLSIPDTLFASNKCSKFFSSDDFYSIDLNSALASYIKEYQSFCTQKQFASYLGISVKKLKEALDGRSLKDLLLENIKLLEKHKTTLLKLYADLSRERGVTLLEDEFISQLTNEFQIFLIKEKILFEDFYLFKQSSMERYEKLFTFVLDDDLYNDETRQALLTAIEKRSRLIITTAVAGAPVDKEFLRALKLYAKKHDAEIIVYPANMQTSGLDPVLLEDPMIHILTNSVELSSFLKLNNIKIMAKQINPLFGLSRLGPRLQTQIIGSPKMHSEAVATAQIQNQMHSKFNFTTGAITLPNYHGKKEISQRTDAIAEMDHMLGALILERSKSSSFIPTQIGDYHIRHIEYVPEKKGFMDIDTFYSATGSVTKISTPAVVLGDIHIGDLNQGLLDPLVDQILSLKPKYIVLGDLFNGRSINHHDRDKVLLQAQRADKNQLSLTEELASIITFLNNLLRLTGPETKLIIQPSNHNEWLKNWLNKAGYIQDPQNFTIGIALSYHFTLEKIDPLQVALLSPEFQEKLSLPIILDRSRVIYLQDDTSFKVAQDSNHPVELGIHGHIGAQGARGSFNAMVRGTDSVVYGHTHSDFRKNRHVNIGTFTKKVLDYQRGFSASVNSLALVGPDGQIQVLYYLNESWYNRSNTRGKDFFEEGFPKIIPNQTGSDQGQLDQYSSSN